MTGRSECVLCRWFVHHVLLAVLASAFLKAQAVAQQAAEAWAVLDRVTEAYRDVYDLRFEYDKWVDYGQDGTVDVTRTGRFLFRLHEQAFIEEESSQYLGRAFSTHTIVSMLRGKYSRYEKRSDSVEGTLYRTTRSDMWTWGAGGVTLLFDPMLIDRKEYVAFLVGEERVGLRRCAHVFLIGRQIVGERRYRELVAMAARGDVPKERAGYHYWVDVGRGVVLKYESVARSREPGKERTEVVRSTTRATEVRRFQSDDVEIWLPVEVEEEFAPFYRYGPLGKIQVMRGHKVRIVIIPDTVEINVRAPDDAYVIDPPPGTRLQPDVHIDESKLPGASVESASRGVTVTKRMMEEADRQLREHGLRPVEPASGSWWRIGVFVAGAVLIGLGLWLRRGLSN